MSVFRSVPGVPSVKMERMERCRHINLRLASTRLEKGLG